MLSRRRNTHTEYFHQGWLHYGRHGQFIICRQSITLRNNVFALCRFNTVQDATRTNAAISRQYQAQDWALLIQSCGKSFHAKQMVRPTLLPDMFRHPEKKQATLLDMQTVRSVAAKLELLTSLTRLGTSDVILAEKDMVRVWAGSRSNTTGKTFNNLRVEHCTSSRAGIYALPPTSSDTRCHIHRGAFIANRACRLLVTDNEHDARLEPVEHWSEQHFDTLLPSKCMKQLLQNVVAMCRCGGSVTLNDVGAVLALFQSVLCHFTRCKWRLNDNLIVLLKTDIDLGMSRSSTFWT